MIYEILKFLVLSMLIYVMLRGVYFLYTIYNYFKNKK